MVSVSRVTEFGSNGEKEENVRKKICPRARITSPENAGGSSETHKRKIRGNVTSDLIYSKKFFFSFFFFLLSLTEM